MANYITVSPAYGRDYRSKAAAIQDWKDGKDFVYHGLDASGRYCSIRDFGPGDVINIRYKKLTQVAPYRMTS